MAPHDEADEAELNARWSAALVHALVEEGGQPRHVVVSPGARSTPLVMALVACPSAQLHSVLDERAAAFYALGLARVCQHAVVLVCTSGSAGAHYGPAVAEAQASQVPLVILTADRPLESHGCGATQTMDQHGLFGSHVRWFRDLGAPTPSVSERWWGTAVSQALDAAQGFWKGPVHLNVAFREPLWRAPSDGPAVCRLPNPRAKVHILRDPPALRDPSLRQLLHRLADHRQGVVVCGPRPLCPDGDLEGAAIGALAQRLGWPLLADPVSQLRFGAQTFEGLISTYDALLQHPGFAQRQAPSCVLRLGQMPISKTLTTWLQIHGADRMVLMDPSGAWTDPTHGADMWIMAEPTALCRSLTAALPQAPGSAYRAAWIKAEAAVSACWADLCEDSWSEASVARAVVEALPEGSLLHMGNSMPMRDVDGFAPALSRSITVVANRGLNGIDGSIACLLGEARLWRRGPVVGLLGDLAFLHDVGALQLARQMHVSATVVVLNNRGGGIFDFLPMARHPTAFEPYFRTPQQADIQALCHATRTHWQGVGSLAGLRHALLSCWHRAGLSVIEADMTSVNNHAWHTHAWKRAFQAIDRIMD